MPCGSATQAIRNNAGHPKLASQMCMLFLNEPLTIACAPGRAEREMWGWRAVTGCCLGWCCAVAAMHRCGCRLNDGELPHLPLPDPAARSVVTEPERSHARAYISLRERCDPNKTLRFWEIPAKCGDGLITGRVLPFAVSWSRYHLARNGRSHDE